MIRALVAGALASSFLAPWADAGAISNNLVPLPTDPHAGSGCGSHCDLHALKFILILGTGRSGSTTLLHMINLLPGVELSGEHDGALFSFLDLDMHLAKTRPLATTSSAWQQNTDLLRKSELYCMVQRWFFLHTGTHCDLGTVHGFKEIRYKDPKILDFIAAAFPGAKLVINYRHDTRAQARSGFHRSQPIDEAAAELTRETESLVGWGHAHPARSFLIATEELNAGNVTALYSWLGYPQCKAASVAHLNDGGFSSVDAVAQAEALLNQVDCGGGTHEGFDDGTTAFPAVISGPAASVPGRAGNEARSLKAAAEEDAGSGGGTVALVAAPAGTVAGGDACGSHCDLFDRDWIIILGTG